MTIPIATTRISILRPVDRSNIDPEDYGDLDYSTVASNIRAVVNASGAYSGSGGPGDREHVAVSLICDPVDMRYLDRIVDDITGDKYEVEWCFNSPGIAGYLALTKAGLTFRS